MRIRLPLAALVAALASVCPARATVTTTTTSTTCVAPGGAMTCNLAFPFINNTDLVVTLNGVPQALGTNYTVACAGCSSGGSVTMVSNPPTGAVLNVSRAVPYTQLFDPRQGPYRPASFGSAYDNLEMQIQQLHTQFVGVGMLTEANGGTGAGPLTCTNAQALTSNGTAYSCTTISGLSPYVNGVLPVNSGGTGAGGITCAAGQALTSNGTTFSCTTVVTAPDFVTAGRTALAFVAGTSDAALTTFGMGAITSPANGNTGYTSDFSTDSTRQMVKGAVTASSTATAWGNVTTTRRQYLPKFTGRVYVPSLGTSNGQDRVVFAGLKSVAPSTTGTGSDCAAQSNINTGAWICYANATLAGWASGTNWIYVRDDGTTAVNTDSNIPVTVGMHTLVVDYTVPGQVTMSVDGTGASTFTTNLGAASTAFGPVISCGTWATLAGYSCSTPGFQVTQTF